MNNNAGKKAAQPQEAPLSPMVDCCLRIAKGENPPGACRWQKTPVLRAYTHTLETCPTCGLLVWIMQKG